MKLLNDLLNDNDTLYCKKDYINLTCISNYFVIQ